MSLHFIEYDGGMHHVYVHDGRGHRTRIGPRIGWEKPRDAIDYANSLDTPFVDPLRSPGDGLPAVESNALDSPPSRPGGAVSERSKARSRRRRAP